MHKISKKGIDIIMNKKGFTLAEILIALGIIGVLSAILLPAFFRSKPNEEMLILKKSYYLMSRAVSEIINDDDFYPDDPEGDNYSGFSNTSSVTYHGQNDIEGNEKFCKLVGAKINSVQTPFCTDYYTLSDGIPAVGFHFTTPEGAGWILPINNFNRGSANSTQSIYVDVNGNKGANCFAGSNGCTKPDRFEFKIDRWGKLSVDDELTRRYLSSTNITKTYKQFAKELGSVE